MTQLGHLQMVGLDLTSSASGLRNADFRKPKEEVSICHALMVRDRKAKVR